MNARGNNTHHHTPTLQRVGSGTSTIVHVDANRLERFTEQLADDARRLRLRAEPGSSLEHLADRLANAAEDTHWLCHPDASELYIDYFIISGDHDLALEEALRTVDTQHRQLRLRCGRDPDGITITPQPAEQIQAAA